MLELRPLAGDGDVSIDIFASTWPLVSENFTRRYLPD